MRRTPRRIFSLWARLGFVVLALFFGVTLAVLLVAKIVKPFQEARVEQASLGSARSKIEILRKENSNYERHIAILNTPDGVASEARRLGYLKPGEIPIVVQGFDSQWTVTPGRRPPDFTARTLSSRMSDLWHRMTSH